MFPLPEISGRADKICHVLFSDQRNHRDPIPADGRHSGGVERRRVSGHS